MYLKYYLLPFLVFSFLLAGCSSKEAVKEKEVKKKVEREVVPPKKGLNFDMKEREFVRNNRIMVIDKIRFDYDKNDKLVLIGKVSTTNYDKNGFLITTMIYGKNETIRDSYSYKFDSDGTRIETDRSDPYGVLLNKFTYDYDKHEIR